MKNNNNRNFNKKMAIGLFIIVIFSSVALPFRTAQAMVPVTDAPSIVTTTLNWMWNFAKQAYQIAKDKIGSGVLSGVVSTAMNRIAFESATWLGSGGKGQKPMFVTKGWGPYLKDAADKAAGDFIEQLGKNKKMPFNLCEPDFNVKLNIGLGLIQYEKPKEPACTFTKMKKNWEKALQDPNFMNNFQDMFNPTSNELGIALTLQTGMVAEADLAKQNADKERATNKGWLDVTGIDGRISNIPGIGEQMAEGIQWAGRLPIIKNYKDELVQAANIFLNQLAITLVNEKLKNLGKKTSGYSYNPTVFTNLGASVSGGGIKETKDYLRKIIQPDFSARGDYNILNELSVCPKPTQAGPTNCVIDEKLRQAIENKSSVGQAIEDGYLKTDGIFGYNSNGLEPNYLEGYPYRSMIILRKFRIIPVGWEVAAKYIKENLNTIGGSKNLIDLINCYDPADNLDGYSATWCEGLVDPNWVLKAPLNYCRRQGAGPEIITEMVSGSYEEGRLAISRNDNYCADEQSCIKENDDGSCQIYGYCTEERRKWKFEGKSCEPKYNTCQTFETGDGNTISYLENTLDYTGCSVDNAGCLAYCTNYNYAASDYTCTNISVGDKIYLDKGAEACDAKNEGCHEFIRTKIGLGANLLLNSSFEEDLAVGNWTTLSTATSTTSYDGLSSLNLPNGAGTKVVTVAPAGYDIGYVNGDVFTLSFYSNGCAASSTFKVDTTQPGLFDIVTGTGWQFNQAAYVVPQGVYGNQVTLNFNAVGAGCLIDAVKLERGYQATTYNGYQSNEKIYEKLLPGYLQAVCYDANWNLLSTAPAECTNFARMCAEVEVGCELFTSVEDKMAVPAKVGAQNYCVPECVGFKSYLATETYFDSSRQENFIPKTAKTCSAATVGCDEFTNLDKVAQGGEAIENYSYLRQCVKPAAVGAACSEFYTWEGSNESGFQLRVVSLDSVSTAGSPDPRVTDAAADAANCNETIYSLAPTDPAYNADCREFYNTSGLKFYHLYSLTVSCDEDCHPYRRTEVNIDVNIGAGACVGADMNWADHNDDAIPECALCKNGGTWSAEHNACIYNAIPSQGRTCQAAAAGCREYTGSTGRNIRVVLNNDFEDGTMQGWVGGNLDNTSIVVGGRSLSVSSAGDVIDKNVSTIVGEDKSYILSFIAKSNGATGITARFENGAASTSVFGTITGVSGDWQIYELNLARLDHQVDAGERLVIVGSGGSGDFYIDNIKLTEIVDRYYLIKNSWTTPAVCNADLSGAPSPNYMLGCEEYTDRDRQTHYLRSFAYLCSESAVGCEMMIDTMNSSNPAASDPVAGEYNYDNDNVTIPASYLDNKDIPADAYIYAVYDKKKQCNSDDKGCERLGKPYNYDGDVIYSDAYLKNNPDKYSSAMCTYDAVFCGEYSTSDGLSYFKDPGDQVCEWRQANASSTWAWYRKLIKRCDGLSTEAVCLTDSDCTALQKCLIETTDQRCPVDNLKTFGFGNNMIEQPTMDASDVYWAGLCPAEFSGCSEMIDPISSFSVNLIFNSDFFQNIDTGDDPARDGWDLNNQQVKIEPNTLYRLAAKDSPAGVNSFSISCNSAIYLLDPVYNTLTYSATPITVSSLEPQFKSVLFYSGYSNDCTVAIGAINVGNTEVELKKAVLDYQLKQELKTGDCNGVVNFVDGCVLFNQRSQNGVEKQGLAYDADTSVDTPNSSAPVTENDSNVLLKVVPDRVCDKWLACRSKVVYINSAGKEENYCSDIGQCNSVDDKGNCDNFLISKKENQSFTPANVGLMSNLDGYSKIGFNWTAGYSFEGDYSLGKMKQQGEVAVLPNNSFETSDESGYPVGWLSEGDDWTTNVFKAISSPYETQKECLNINCGIKVPDGGAFLRLGAAYSAVSEFVDVAGGLSYIISAQMNTVNLAGARARVTIEQYQGSGSIIGAETRYFELDSGKGWEKMLRRINMNANTSRVKVILSTFDIGAITGTGNAYFDDIKIMPALETYDLTPAVTNDENYWYTPQTCRLYPQTDSLSCDYIDEKGVRQLGWPGYCLEYDRAPGSEDACLLWWPTERVKGDGIQEGAGYQGRYPVYYCTESTSERFFEYRHAFFGARSSCGGSNYACPSGYINRFAGGSCDCCDCGPATGCSCRGNTEDDYCEPVGALIIADGTPGTGYACGVQGGVTSPSDGWYIYDGSLFSYPNAAQVSGTNPQVDYLCKGNSSCTFSNEQIKSEFSPEFFTTQQDLATYMGINVNQVTAVAANQPKYCTALVQTVTPSGQNKYWSGRVYEGSAYPEICYTNGTTGATTNCLYSADYKPFGSIVYPKPENIPNEWDSKTYDGYQPLYYEAPITTETAPYQPRMGQLHNQDGLKRLFAKSYGAWRWVASTTYSMISARYVKNDILGQNWDVPGSNGIPEMCPGGVRPTTAPGDWCAILPVVDDLQIEKATGNTTVIKNGFVNLTFTTHLDSQQKPLIMYVVDWADDEYTISTGIELNDRPYNEQPHSLYHLYSYWDLKSKAGLPNTDIDCSAANECRVRPRVKIKDNWGYCNEGVNEDTYAAETPNLPNDCNQVVLFVAEVIVREN